MLAIIIPFFKRAFFEATLQSLANQTDQRFKVYIGDDSSPEDCSILLKQFQGQFDFFYHRFDSNLGGKSLTKQWDRCIALSEKEDWIMILGDDDVLGSNVVAEFYSNLSRIQAVPSNVVRFASQVVNNAFSENAHIYTHPITEQFSDSFYRKISGSTRSSLSEHLFLRSVYLKYGFKNFNLAWYSDDFAWLTFSENQPIYSINNAVVKIGVSPKSISGNTTLDSEKNNAKFHFFREIISVHYEKFAKMQKLKLLNSYEQSLFNLEKVEIKAFLKLIILYVQQHQYKRVLKMIKRYGYALIK